jgi:hypothetical protein
VSPISTTRTRTAPPPREAAPAPELRAAELLREAGLIVADGFGDDRLALAARQLISCAAEVVTALQDSDLEAAREALGSARAAVVSATYAVRVLHDKGRTG